MSFAEGARYERLWSYLAGVTVDLDVEAEGVVDGAFELGLGVGEWLAQVGEGVQYRACLGEVDVAAALLFGVDLCERGFGGLTLGLEAVDALAYQRGVYAGFDGSELAFGALPDGGELVLEPLALGV